MPLAASAQQVHFPYWGTNPPILPCTGLECVDLCQLLLLFQRLIYFGMTLAVLFVAPILILWGAFLIIISGGSAERVSKGKTVLTSTIVGIIITLGAFLIVTTFLHFLGNTQGYIDPKTGQPAYVSWPNIACTVQATPPSPAPPPPAAATVPPAGTPPPAALPPASPPVSTLACGVDNSKTDGGNGPCPDSRDRCEYNRYVNKYQCARISPQCGEIVGGSSIWGACANSSHSCIYSNLQGKHVCK